MARRISRRRMLASAGAATAGILVLRGGAPARAAAADKLNVALVGVGGRGNWFVDTIPRMANVVAMCDVNDQKMASAFKHWEHFGKEWSASQHSWERSAAAVFRSLLENRPRTFRDFRRMLDEMGRSIDAVVVATPDHSHAVVAAAAMRAGKHVFVEKPLTRTVHESRALRELARKQKVATSMGNQGTCGGAFRRALELIRRGEIGDISEVYVWNTGGGADRRETPKGEVPVPEYLDWDLWLGPAAMRPYHPMWMQRHLWRELGTCQLGNWGPHTANLAFMALKVHELWLDDKRQPPPIIRVEAQTSGINRLSFPKWEIVKWHVPARAGLPAITIVWYNGDGPGAAELRQRATAGGEEKDKPLWQFAGTLIVGSRGSIHATGHNMFFRLLPEERFKDVQRERPETVESSRGPEQDWLAACRGGPAPWSSFDYAAALNEFLMLGNVATQFDTPIEYDPIAARIVNNREADALLGSEYRRGWSL